MHQLADETWANYSNGDKCTRAKKSHKKKKIHLFKRHRVDSECNRTIFEEVSFGGEKGKRKNPAILKMVCAFSDYFWINVNGKRFSP